MCVPKECFGRVQMLSLRCGDRFGMWLSTVRIGWLGGSGGWIVGWRTCCSAAILLMHVYTLLACDSV